MGGTSFSSPIAARDASVCWLYWRMTCSLALQVVPNNKEDVGVFHRPEQMGFSVGRGRDIRAAWVIQVPRN